MMITGQRISYVKLRPKNICLVMRRLYSPICGEDPCGLPPHQVWNENAGGVSCLGDDITDGAGLILGAFYDQEDSSIVCLTKAAALFNHNVKGKLLGILNSVGSLPKLGEVRILSKVDPAYSLVTVVGLGDNNVGYSSQEKRDEYKENIRKGVGAACRILQNFSVEKVYVEGFDEPEAAAEGATMAIWANQQQVSPNNRRIKIPDIIMYHDCDFKKWRIGLEKGDAQNFARRLMETPANIMTPRALAYEVVSSLCRKSVNATLRGENWLKENNMNAFISNTRGSPQPPFLLELDYNGCDTAIPPVVLIGKGLTFNSGGLGLKTCEEMKYMRGDMAGAAVVISTFKALANLGLPINVKGLIPLGENMPGGSASRPRDIVKSTSGKTILVNCADFDGNLLLADTLCYAQKFKPKYIISMTTMSKEVKRSFGLMASGVFTSNEKLWQLLKTASVHSGDRLWKLPLWDTYDREVVDFSCADLSTLTKYPKGLPCSNSSFLRQFICKPNWAHIDMMGTMYEDGTTSYLRRGMSGRPTRTLIEFLGQMAYPPLDLINNQTDSE